MVPGAGIYLTALRTLAGDRPRAVGMGGVITGQIPFASKVCFAARYGVDHINDFDSFVRILTALDIAEVKYINDKANPPKNP